MVLQKNTALLGEGRLSSAVKIGDAINFYVKNGSVIEKYVLAKGKRNAIKQKIVSYKDDYFEIPNGYFYREREELFYESF